MKTNTKKELKKKAKIINQLVDDIINERIDIPNKTVIMV